MDEDKGKLTPRDTEPRHSASASVEADITRTRARMDGTISQIQDRLSFHRLAEDLGDLLTEGTGAGSLRVLQGIRKKPGAGRACRPWRLMPHR